MNALVTRIFQSETTFIVKDSTNSTYVQTSKFTIPIVLITAKLVNL